MPPGGPPPAKEGPRQCGRADAFVCVLQTEASEPPSLGSRASAGEPQDSCVAGVRLRPHVVMDVHSKYCITHSTLLAVLIMRAP